MVCIGQLNDFAALVETNFELLKKKLKQAVVMSGNFLQKEDFDGARNNSEFNVLMDIKSAETVINGADLPIDFIDFNNGVDIRTGNGLNGQEDNPVYKMYKLHGEGRECASWDIVALLYAVDVCKDCFETSSYGKVFVNGNGKTLFLNKTGRHRIVYIKNDKKAALRSVINELLKNDSK